MSNLVERVRDDIGPYLQEQMGEHSRSTRLVGEARMVGLMGAFEIVQRQGNAGALSTRDDGAGSGLSAIKCHCQRSLCLRAIGRHDYLRATIYVLSHAEADELIDKTLRTLEQTRDGAGVTARCLNDATRQSTLRSPARDLYGTTPETDVCRRHVVRSRRKLHAKT